MARIFKYLPHDNYTKMDNNVARIEKNRLCDGAKVLYMFLAGFRNGKMIQDSYILQSLEISRNSLDKYKRQLKKLDLIYIERISSRSYNLYLGYTDFPASKVYEYWYEIDHEKGKPLTLEEIIKIRKKAEMRGER